MIKNTLDIYIKKFLGEHNARRRLLLIMLMLALLVSTAVYWRLKYVGIAMTNEVYCGLEEHTHTDDCYEDALVCGYEEGEEVYPGDETLSGEALTPEIHVHTDGCYEKVLVCGMEEHTHTVDCLVDHSLDDPVDTADTETEETETASEGETADAETEISSDEPQVSAQEGSDASDSSESGGGTDSSSADMSEEDYDEADFDLPELTGYALTDFILTAQSQIGYRESKTDYIVSEEENCRKGFTKFGEWYGVPYGNWDATFVSYCLDYAGISDDIFPKNSGAYGWFCELEGLDLYYDKADYTPKAGDIVFFDTDDNEKPDRTGVLTSVIDEDEGKITVVEGDFTDGNIDLVCENEYFLSDDMIIGFGVIPEEEAQAAEIFTAEDSGVKVQVTAPDTALPEGAELYILLYDENRSEYRAAGEAIGLDDEGTSMAALDIAFTLNGEKTEPTEEVAVRIDISDFLPEEADPRTVAVSHLEEKDGEIEPVLVADLSDGTEGTIDTEAPAAEFTVSSFSDFTITWQNYTDSSDYVEIPVTAYVYNNGITTTQMSGVRSENIITNISSEESHNTVNLTSTNEELKITTTSTSGGGWSQTTYTYTYTVATATVNLVINGSTISVTDARYISVTGSSSEGYTYTITTSSGTVIYTDVTSASIYLYYELSETTTSSGQQQGGQSNQELDASSYNAGSYVYWDVFEYDENDDKVGVGSGNAAKFIQSVTMGANGQTYVGNENSNTTSWSASTNQLSDYFPNADPGEEGSWSPWGSTSSTPAVTESGTLTITPVTGYYVTQVVIACCGGGMGGGGMGGGSSYSTPYECNTWDGDNAYDVTFSVNASGVMEVDVSSLYFSHGSSSDYYFILIRVSPVADPLYIQYDYGDISFLNIDESTYTGAFSSASGWTDASGSNSYGTTNTQLIADGEVGVKTEDTQFKYGYEDVSETADWRHYANTITDAAKEEAAAAGYYFAGWKTEYYYYVVPYFYSATYNTSPYSTAKSYIYSENYVYSFADTDLYYTTSYGEGDLVNLPTHAKLIAQWEPVSMTITKTVSGLTGSDYDGTSRTYTILVQRSTDNGTTWEDYETVQISVSGDGSNSVTISPVKPGLYRVEETGGNTNLVDSGSTMYIVVSDGGTLEVTSDQVASAADDLSLEVVNTYYSYPMERLPDTGGGSLNLILLAGVIIAFGFMGIIVIRR